MRRLFPLAVLLILLPLSGLNAATSPKPGADGSSAPAQADGEGGRISVTAKADTVTPYQNQPVLYTVRVLVRTGISKMSASNIDITNAIVEETGGAEVSDDFEHGRPVKVAEFRYIITPLQAGKITIPAVVLEGEFQAPSLAVPADPSGNSAVSSATQQALNFFSTYGAETFNITSNATVLNVKPPVAAMDPWLPLTSLKISEKIDASRSVHVGEPVTRKITLSATGAVGSQLPDIGAQQQFGNFRVYADRPVMGENFDSKTAVISGWRTDSYSVIARNAGPLVLPAIRISWWDVVNNRAAIAELPERVLHILPAKTAQGPPVNGDHSRDQQQAGKSQQRQTHWLQNAFADIGRALPYAGVSVVIAALLFGAFRWREPKRNILRFKEAVFAAMRVKPGPPNVASGMSSGGTLKDVQTAEELKIFLQAYAHRHWGTPKNASLEMIFSISPDSRTKLDDEVKALTKKIGAALYAGGTADVEDLKKRFGRVIKALKARAKSNPENREELSVLNPS
jgi:hypothetical protein